MKTLYQRKSLRLKKYDYSQRGLYFVTICEHGHHHYFSKIIDGVLYLNDVGQMIKKLWLTLPQRFATITLHEFVIMPNHFHAILEMHSDNAYLLGEIIGTFKSLTTFEYTLGVKNHGWKPFDKKLWQRNYYEHIIRNHTSYLQLSQYIQNNPIKWKEDTLFSNHP